MQFCKNFVNIVLLHVFCDISSSLRYFAPRLPSSEPVFSLMLEALCKASQRVTILSGEVSLAPTCSRMIPTQNLHKHLFVNGRVSSRGGRTSHHSDNYHIAGGLKLLRISRFCSCLQVFSMKLGSVASFGNNTSEQSAQVFSLKVSHYMMVCSDNLPRTMDVSHKNGSVD